MSREETPINETTQIVRGSDHALGYFIDIKDKRYANSGLDEQGEGYLVEWSTIFGFSQNKIGILQGELKDMNRVNELVDKYIETL
jgi:hypothetical protein